MYHVGGAPLPVTKRMRVRPRRAADGKAEARCLCQFAAGVPPSSRPRRGAPELEGIASSGGGGPRRQ
jgi:hypothetical protein